MKEKLQNNKEVRAELLETVENKYSFSPGPTPAEAVGIPESFPGHSKAGTFSPLDRKSETP